MGYTTKLNALTLDGVDLDPAELIKADKAGAVALVLTNKEDGTHDLAYVMRGQATPKLDQEFHGGTVRYVLNLTGLVTQCAIASLKELT